MGSVCYNKLKFSFRYVLASVFLYHPHLAFETSRGLQEMVLDSECTGQPEINNATGCVEDVATATAAEDATSSESEPEYATSEFLHAERLRVMGFDAMDEGDDSCDELLETIDVEAEFKSCPDSVTPDDHLQMLGTIQASGIENMAVVVPTNPDLIVDVGTFVVADTTRLICGVVWDVFGPVSSPMYAVAIRPGMIDFFAEGRTLLYSRDTVNFVSTETLLKERGVDAESDSACEFSDDESERLHRRGKEQGEL